MALSKLKAKIKGTKYLPFRQGLITYNLYDLPKGFVIEGDLDLENKGLTELPDLSEVVVKGYFDCSNNKLTSLEGAPKTVGRYFSCACNQLTSLEGAPKKVGTWFNCNSNQLTSLEGAPQTVGEDFRCGDNQLTSLEGAPQTVGGDFVCGDNQLTSLVGVPQMNEGYEIYCDDSLGAKYGFYDARNFGISYKELCASPLYKSETAMNRVRSKQQEKQAETKSASSEQQKTVDLKQQETFEKINAEFSQWLKDNTNKPTRE